jgi:signal transduction histidine kinase/CheY-like chemotaxis protein
MVDSNDLQGEALSWTSATNRGVAILPIAAATCSILVGLIVIVAWYASWLPVLQLIPGGPLMKFNTAVGFVAAGFGLGLLSRGRERLAVSFAIPAVMLGLATLLEYATGRNLGIDQFFVTGAIDSATAFPGRMSPLAATSFCFIGLALIAPGISRSRTRLLITGLLSCAGAMIGFISMAGYVFGIQSASGWGAYTRMALHTSTVFFLLGCGLLAWAWKRSRVERYDFVRWLPIVAAVTLMAMIVLISRMSFSELNRADHWENHTHEVLNTAQFVLGDLGDVQRGVRGYVLSGQQAALDTYHHATGDLPTRLANLQNLTRDNPSQQERLQALNAAVDNVLIYARLLRDARDEHGIAGAVAIESTGDGLTVMDTARTQLQAFTDEEQRLLKVRSKVVDDDFKNTKRLTTAGSFMAALLIISATWLVNRQMKFRRRAEKKLEEAVEQQKELTVQALAAERAKSEFLAVMSHEIRTPMNGVIGMTSLLADTDLSAEQQDFVGTIRTSGESLLIVINDILDFSKIESGRMNLEMTPFRLRQCIEEAIDLFAVQIRLKRLEIAYLIDPEVPQNLVGDGMRLRQIFVNLIGNAIKFTALGEIVIHVKYQSGDDKGCRLLFSVKDTGIGISEEGVSKLFQSFQQVDSSTTRKYGGTGLGLAISKRLAALMGGKMWVESKVGMGSTFFFTTVMRPCENPETVEHLPDPSLLKSRHVLVVDDNDTNRHILETQLRIWGMIPVSASSGKEALQKITEQKFDAALLDFQMPEMDGVALAAKIHQQSDLPLILLSSSGEKITGTEAAHFQYQVPKPIRHSVLLNALVRACGGETQPAQKVAEKQFDAQLAVRHPLRILLAEDNVINQKVGIKMLSHFGYQADLAADGLRAVDALNNHEYDLILMDIQMPEMDGIEATRMIRERMADRQPAIVALTAEAMDGDRERFLGLGFDDYLSKPLQTRALQDVLESIKLRNGK